MRGVVAISLAVLISACGSSTQLVSTEASGPSGEPCVPAPSASVVAIDVPGGSDRRGEALVLYLSGVDELAVTAETEGDELDYGSPLYGGVWGDRAGGWVAAVTDCEAFDADEVAALAGGPDSVRLIHVGHSFEEVNRIRDALVEEVRAAGIEAEVGIDSTLTGRKLVMMIGRDQELPDGFGNSVPPELLTIVRADFNDYRPEEVD